MRHRNSKACTVDPQVFGTELAEWASLQLPVLAVRYPKLCDLAGRLRVDNGKTVDVIPKGKYKGFLQSMMDKLTILLVGINEAKAKASDANPLSRFEVTAMLLSADAPTITAQKHHDMVKSFAKSMADTAELFRRETVIYDAIISKHVAELQEKIMIVRALMDWVSDLMLKTSQIEEVIDLKEEAASRELTNETEEEHKENDLTNDAHQKNYATQLLSIHSETISANKNPTNITHYQQMQFDATPLLTILQIFDLHSCECKICDLKAHAKYFEEAKNSERKNSESLI